MCLAQGHNTVTPVRLKPAAPPLIDMIKVVFVFCISVVFLKNEYGSCLWRVQSLTYEPVHEISNNVVCVTSKASDQPAHMRRLIRAFASPLSIL